MATTTRRAPAADDISDVDLLRAPLQATEEMTGGWLRLVKAHHLMIEQAFDALIGEDRGDFSRCMVLHKRLAYDEFDNLAYGHRFLTEGPSAPMNGQRMPVLALNAVPCLLALWLLLGIGHLRLAWALVDCDWSRVVKVCALIGATMVTLFIVMGVLLLDVTFLISQVPALAIELAGLLAAERWHARIFPNAAPEMTAA